MFHLSSLLLLIAALATTAEAVDVSSNGEFWAALTDESVSTIALTQDIALYPRKGLPYTLNRNLYVTAAASAASYPLLESGAFNFEHDNVVLGRNVTVNFQHIMISDRRRGFGLIVNWLDGAYIDDALIFTDVVRHRVACTPANVTYALYINFPRPPSFPGTQTVGIWDEYCLHGKCYKDALHSIDFASAVASGSGGYYYVVRNYTVICDRVVTIQCIDTYGSDACVTRTIEQMLGSGARRQKVIIISCVTALSGALLIAGALAFYWFWKLRSSNNILPVSILDLHEFPNPHWALIKNGVVTEPTQKDNLTLGMVVGCGSFGMVYRANWQDRRVAVKVLAHSCDAIDVIANEFEIVKNIKHSNVVETLHCCTWIPKPKDLIKSGPEVRTFIIQEFCNCGTFGFMLLDISRPVLRDTRERLLLQVAQAMTFLHSRNVVHGDLTLNNIMLHNTYPNCPEYGYVAKVADFGLSKTLSDDHTHTNTNSCGTITHMPPERFADGCVSKAGDVYAFGIMIWITWNRQKPYKGCQYKNVIDMVCHDLRPDVGEVPAGWADIMTDCWRGDRALRPTFQTISDRICQVMLDHKD